MALTVPKTTMPAGGWPLVIFAHGTGGSFRSHVPEGVAANLAGAMSSAGVATPMAVLGIDQVETGTRRGASTESPDNLFYNFANPGASRGNPMQGAADQASLFDPRQVARARRVAHRERDQVRRVRVLGPLAGGDRRGDRDAVREGLRRCRSQRRGGEPHRCAAHEDEPRGRGRRRAGGDSKTRPSTSTTPCSPSCRRRSIKTIR